MLIFLKANDTSLLDHIENTIFGPLFFFSSLIDFKVTDNVFFPIKLNNTVSQTVEHLSVSFPSFRNTHIPPEEFS